MADAGNIVTQREARQLAATGERILTDRLYICSDDQLTVQSCAVSERIAADAGHAAGNFQATCYSTAVVERIASDACQPFGQLQRSDLLPVFIPRRRTGTEIAHLAGAGYRQLAIFTQCPHQAIAAGSLRRDAGGGFRIPGLGITGFCFRFCIRSHIRLRGGLICVIGIKRRLDHLRVSILGHVDTLTGKIVLQQSGKRHHIRAHRQQQLTQCRTAFKGGDPKRGTARQRYHFQLTAMVECRIANACDAGRYKYTAKGVIVGESLLGQGRYGQISHRFRDIEKLPISLFLTSVAADLGCVVRQNGILETSVRACFGRCLFTAAAYFGGKSRHRQRRKHHNHRQEYGNGLFEHLHKGTSCDILSPWSMP